MVQERNQELANDIAELNVKIYNQVLFMNDLRRQLKEKTKDFKEAEMEDSESLESFEDDGVDPADISILDDKEEEKEVAKETKGK